MAGDDYDQCLVRLRRSLSTHESVIERLFSVEPFPASIICENIRLLQTEISSSIPVDESGNALYQEWNDKIVSFWHRYSIKYGEQKSSSLSSSENDCRNLPDARPLPQTSNNSDTPNTQTCDDNMKSTQLSGNFSDLPASKLAIWQYLHMIFERLSANSDNDCIDWNSLYSATKLAHSLTLPFWRETCFENDMFNLAFGKLTPDNQKQFQQLYGLEKSLDNLFQYISKRCEGQILPNEISNKDDTNIDHREQLIQKRFAYISTDSSKSLRELLWSISNTGRHRPHDDRSYQIILNLAIQKLPLSLRERFTKSRGFVQSPFNSLKNLRNFILDHISASTNVSQTQSSPNFDDLIINKNEILSWTEEKLKQLPTLASEDDIDTIKTFHEIVVQLNSSFEHQRIGSDLANEIFQLLSRQLSPTIEEKFSNFNSTFHWSFSRSEIFPFVLFLNNLSKNYYQELNLKNWDKNEKLLQQAIECRDSGSTPEVSFCYYCKEISHFIGDCPILREMRCNYCLRRGHRASACPKRLRWQYFVSDH